VNVTSTDFAAKAIKPCGDYRTCRHSPEYLDVYHNLLRGGTRLERGTQTQTGLTLSEESAQTRTFSAFTCHERRTSSSTCERRSRTQSVDILHVTLPAAATLEAAHHHLVNFTDQ
jgi:hypothetical protein